MSATLTRQGERLRSLSARNTLLAAFAAGAMSALGFAPFNLFPLLLAGYAVLAVLMDGVRWEAKKKWRAAAGIGWSFGFGQFLVGLHWIGYPFLVDPANHGWQMPFAVLFMTGGLALFPLLACVAACLFQRDGIARILLLAACLAVGEWLRGHIFTGFPWNLAAYGWGASTEILQSTSIVGAYGLSLLTLIFGTSLAELFAPRRSWRLPGTMVLFFVLLWVGGAIRLSTGPAEYVSGVRLRLVQPNIPQTEKDSQQYMLRNWQRLLDLSVSAKGPTPTHIIWPEAAAPFLLANSPGALQQIEHLTEGSRVLITGAVRQSAGASPRYFNSLYVFGGSTTLAYDKFHLVPFGEYLPFAGALNAVGITKLTAGEVGFTAGSGPRTLNIPHAPPAGPLICYEIIFPGAVAASPRPEWFINLTNDAWFGPWAGPRQHLLSARVRAIEEGVPVVRAANTGISAVIDGMGRLVTVLSLNQTGIIDSALPKVLSLTVYGRYGDFVFLILLLGCVAGIGLRGRK